MKRQGLWISVLGIGIASLASAQPSLANGKQVLDDLRLRYAAVRSVHAVADATIRRAVTPRQPDVTAHGSVEYWAEGNRYRIKCHTSPDLELARDLDIAYDGSTLQVFDAQSLILSIGRHDTPHLPTALPNPFFLPLEFLSDEGDACQGCRMKLADLSNEHTWNKTVSVSKAVESETTDALEKVEYGFAGKSMKSEPQHFETVFSKIDGVPVPTTIRRKRSDGSLDQHITLERHAIVDPSLGPIPKRIRVESYEETHHADQATYDFEILEINHEIPDSVFKIDSRQARAIWDGDAMIFVKHWNSKVVGRPAKPPSS